MELGALQGGRLDKSVFDVDGDREIDTDDYVTITVLINGEEVEIAVPVTGRRSRVGIIKTPAVIEAGTLEYKYFGGSEGGIEVVREAGGEEDDFGRRSWRQLR